MQPEREYATREAVPEAWNSRSEGTATKKRDLFLKALIEEVEAALKSEEAAAVDPGSEAGLVAARLPDSVPGRAPRRQERVRFSYD